MKTNKNTHDKDKLSIEECREKLGDIAIGMTDERVAQIRDYLYALVHSIIDNELNKFRSKIN